MPNSTPESAFKRIKSAAVYSPLTVTVKTSVPLNVAANNSVAVAGATVAVTTPSDFWTGWPGAAVFQMDYYINRTYLEAATLVYCGGDYAKETGWSDPAYEKLIATALKTPDKKKRNDIIGEAQAIEYDRGGYIITSFYNKLDAHSAKVSGFGGGHPSGNSLNNFTLRSVGFTA